jgi:hypothetical protein
VKLTFTPRNDCYYRFDYTRILQAFAEVAQKDPARAEQYIKSTCRQLVLNDLFFIVYFVMSLPFANKPFVVDACREVEFGPVTNTLDLWAREHFKTTIGSAEMIQRMLKNPELCTGIFSYVRPLAKSILRGVKQAFENSDLLKVCFPDIVWQKPENEAPKWSEDDGLILRRKSISRRESTLEAWGLVEGMPVGRHFDHREYDDIETDDLCENMDMMRKCIHKFEMSQYLGVDGGTHRVKGTYYHHAGPMAYIAAKKLQDGSPAYIVRKKPGTSDGTPTGTPVLVTLERMQQLMADKKTFRTQFLLDPTPSESAKLNKAMLRPISPERIPTGLIKFMLVDPAGENVQKSSGDSWSFAVVGVKPQMDDIGCSEVYILDLEAGPMSHSEAIDAICRMYLRNGFIQQLGVEKVGQATEELHIANGLRAAGRFMSEEAGNLKLLKPANRKKEKRVEAALQWPLNNGKIFYSTAIRQEYIEELFVEMDKFPFYHVDILDMLAYLWDILVEFPFGKFEPTSEVDLTDVFWR